MLMVDFLIFSLQYTPIGLCLVTKSVDLRQNFCASILYFVVRVRCHYKVHVCYVISWRVFFVVVGARNSFEFELLLLGISVHTDELLEQI